MIHEAPVETIKVPKTDAATFDDQGFTNSFFIATESVPRTVI